MKSNLILRFNYFKKTEEEKKRARKIMKQIKIRNEVKNIINGIIDDVVNLSEGKKEIIKIFNTKVRGEVIDTSSKNDKHCGAEGHILEELMGIKPNGKNEPDILGYEMKKDSKRITFGDWSAEEYLFSKKRSSLLRINEKDIHVPRSLFIELFGTPNKKKGGRYSWSGKCFPSISGYNDCGQVIEINEMGDIVIKYNPEKDQRDTSKLLKELKIQQNEVIIIAYWSKERIKEKVENKFNHNGFFICKKEKGVYVNICFGKRLNYELFINEFKKGIIFIDSGMYAGNNRPYSQFRANDKLWHSLIVEEY